ncbi:Ger(x)C family spore germination protein [Ammoniphilus sp. CFH 90114]|uniref:Ger(x)C family spore germination protein n=1 Tax=Ammoniphilus sp. CFH 90114 TaxID=2493665 RepID=UPI0013E92737|nr:Ger(x)C family spore germination protein [Ammoniphilus sp. CFH 90114]
MRMFHIIFLLTSFFLTTGCWDKTELEELAEVIVIGIDQAENGYINITYKVANPEVGTSAKAGGNEEEPAQTFSLTATDFFSAKDIANSFITRKMTYNHVRTLIVSEDFSRSDEFLKFAYTMTRDRELRRDTWLIISKESAKEFIQNNKPKFETRPHKYYQFMMQRSMETGLVPPSSLHRFLQVMEGGEDLFLAPYVTTKKENKKKDGNEDEFLAGQVPKEGGDIAQVIGSAVIKKGKVIGTLTGEETRLAILLDNTLETEEMLVTYPDPLHPKYRIAARLLKKQSTDIKMKLDSETPEIEVHVPITLEVIAIPSMEDYVEDIKKQQLLKDSLETGMKDKMLRIINKSQTEFEACPFYWSMVARKQFLTNQEYKKFDWKSQYPKARIDVSVSIQLNEFGLKLRTTENKNYKDE